MVRSHHRIFRFAHARSGSWLTGLPANRPSAPRFVSTAVGQVASGGPDDCRSSRIRRSCPTAESCSAGPASYIPSDRRHGRLFAQIDGLNPPATCSSFPRDACRKQSRFDEARLRSRNAVQGGRSAITSSAAESFHLIAFRTLLKRGHAVRQVLKRECSDRDFHCRQVDSGECRERYNCGEECTRFARWIGNDPFNCCIIARRASSDSVHAFRTARPARRTSLVPEVLTHESPEPLEESSGSASEWSARPRPLSQGSPPIIPELLVGCPESAMSCSPSITALYSAITLAP
jgi:hypothetical protein